MTKTRSGRLSRTQRNLFWSPVTDDHRLKPWADGQAGRTAPKFGLSVPIQLARRADFYKSGISIDA